MTAPTTEAAALRDALARTLAKQDGWHNPDAPFTDNLSLIARGHQGSPVYEDYLEDADALLAGPLAPLLAQAEDDRGWKDTHRYCERQWQNERGFMLDKIAAAEADAAAARAEIDRLRAVLDFESRAHRVEKTRAGRLADRVEAMRAERDEVQARADDALRRAIRAWSARLHIPVTRMMSRELRAEFRSALAQPEPQEGTR